eukprot:11303797-Heterocapsa_arctica.AAC.1
MAGQDHNKNHNNMWKHNKNHNGAASGGAPGAPGPWGCGFCYVFRIVLAGHVLEIPDGVSSRPSI